MRARALVAVFAKPPRPGRVKTRLAQDIKNACPTWSSDRIQDLVCALAQAFVDDTWSLLSSFSDLRRVLATTGPMQAAGNYDDRSHRWSQGDGDLGQRMRRVLRRGLEDHSIAIVLGADSPGLSAQHLIQAVEQLEAGADAVLGPCEDGGFYLLGLRRCPAGLLEDIRWSEPDTREQTRLHLEAEGFSVHQLPPYFDVDGLKDLRRLWQMIEDKGVVAEATRAVLNSTAALTLRTG